MHAKRIWNEGQGKLGHLHEVILPHRLASMRSMTTRFGRHPQAGLHVAVVCNVVTKEIATRRSAIRVGSHIFDLCNVGPREAFPFG